MIHSGQPARDFIDSATRHVLLRQGVLGIKVKIMRGSDPDGKSGPQKSLPDIVTVIEPKEESPIGQPSSQDYVSFPGYLEQFTQPESNQHMRPCRVLRLTLRAQLPLKLRHKRLLLLNKPVSRQATRPPLNMFPPSLPPLFLLMIWDGEAGINKSNFGQINFSFPFSSEPDQNAAVLQNFSFKRVFLGWDVLFLVCDIIAKKGPQVCHNL